MRTWIIVSCGVIGLGSSAMAMAQRMPTPLTSIGVVSDPDAHAAPDDPGTGGGLSTEAYFRNRLDSKQAIGACAVPVEASAAAWAMRFALVRGQRVSKADGITLDYVKPGLKGLFELTYRVSLKTHARVTLNFYAQDGAVLDPATTDAFLKAYGIAQFEDALDVAVRCGGKAV